MTHKTGAAATAPLCSSLASCGSYLAIQNRNAGLAKGGKFIGWDHRVRSVAGWVGTGFSASRVAHGTSGSLVRRDEQFRLSDNAGEHLQQRGNAGGAEQFHDQHTVQS